MHEEKIKVFYKPCFSNDFNWKLKEYVKAELDSDTGVKEVYIQTFSKDLKRKEAISAINKPDKGSRIHSITRRSARQVKHIALALVGLNKINWKTMNKGSVIVKGESC